MYRDVSLYTVDGSQLVATVQVPINDPEPDYEVVLYLNRWFKKIDFGVYFECANIIVL